MKDNKLMVFIAVFLAMLFWGYSFVWYKIAYLYYKPFTVIFFRLIFSAIILTIFLRIKGNKEKVIKKDMIGIMLMALCQPFFYFLGEGLGMYYVSATVGAIIIATIPLVTPIFAHHFLQEKIHISLILGLVISFIGVYMIVQGDYRGSNSIKGILLLFFAVLAAVSYGVLLKKMSHKYSAFTIVKYQNIFGMLYFLPLFLIWEWDHFIHTDHQLAGVWVIFQMALFASTLAFVFITYVIKHLGMSRTNIFTNLIPVFTAIISFFVLGERFPFLKILGIVIVISGLTISKIRYITGKNNR
ncbi:DMT family transporter [Candidatus Cloacimonadota bacterium]